MRPSTLRAFPLLVAAFIASLTIPTPVFCAEDTATRVEKGVQQSTLDQSGTAPFHLKATYAPSLERDKSSNRVGEIEIWWQSPQHWRREMHSPEFRQIQIVDGTHEWQKNEGDYLPEWLLELARAIVRPVPLTELQLAERLKTAEVRQLASQTNVDWEELQEPGDPQVTGKGHVALTDSTGRLFYSGGQGWGGLYHDFARFHGQQIARTVATGSIEVTAKINVLEDLGPTPSGFFDAMAPGGDPQPIHTAVISEADLRANLIPADPFQWPPLADGPLEGVVWTEVTVDRTGRIREMLDPISDNPGLIEAADRGFRAMRFKPVLRDGVPVEATARLSVRFKTVRPAGMENFQSARTYFDQGRKATFPAYGNGVPYILRARFELGTASGVQTGRYEDTWLAPGVWRRDAWFGSSHVSRSQNGEHFYKLTEGSDVALLQLVMNVVEPIPAEDTMTESDWRIRRDAINGSSAIRVMRGPEKPDGTPDVNSQAFWFAPDGHLLKSYSNGLDIVPSERAQFATMQVPRATLVSKDGKLGMRVSITEIVPPPQDAAKNIPLKGHDWRRAFTADQR